MGALVGTMVPVISVGLVFSLVIGLGFRAYKHSVACKTASDKTYDIQLDIFKEVMYIKGRLDGTLSGQTDT